ncbi:MAG: GTP-binding protein [Patescibacteria group bacterium]
MQAPVNIRNFCIIAHIDHGKSTLADRLMEVTGTVQQRDMQAQLLDSNPIERERGITIKLAPVRMIYQFHSHPHESEDPDSRLRGNDIMKEFILNLIDTPGHVDFNYEVSRSLAACEGAILVVDATQGVQAQTLANLTLARKQNLTIIPVINKIDLPNSQVAEVTHQLINLGFKEADIISISAKTGTNIDILLKTIIERIPSPANSLPPDGLPLRALVFSSQYDTHKGVVVYVRIVDGSYTFKGYTLQGGIKPDHKLKFMASGVEIEPIEIGYFTPQMRESMRLNTGEVGYIATGLKDVRLAKVGDTITISNFKFQISNNTNKNSQPTKQNPKLTTHNSSTFAKASADKQPTTYNLQPLPGYKEPKPMVFLGLYPIQSDEINEVREALGKLRLSDSAFSYRPIASLALGHGFHCGFLGLLHAEVVQERLSREFGLNLLATAPTVEYKLKLKNENSVIPDSDRESIEKDPRFHGDDKTLTIQSPTEFPDPSLIEQSFEPVMEVAIFSPKKYVGPIMQLCQTKRAQYIDLIYISEQAKFTYLIPLSEMIVDFFDTLKSTTEGYASLDYEFFDYQPVNLAKLDILLNHEKVDAFSQLVVSERAESTGRNLVTKLKGVIPRQQFAIPIQAAIGGTVIAREDVSPFRKDVTQKLYGGDRSRKDKLLEAQRKGKKRMKMVGKVEIPQEAFLKVFRSG